MPTVIVTGSGGLVGSEAVRFFSQQKWDVVGIDNDMRASFFGREASTASNLARLERDIPGYRHLRIDIRDRDAVEQTLADHSNSLGAIVHCAAQPSHDWAAREPHIDFTINALGTLNLLEATRVHAPETPFIFTSTNKVYGDSPNRLPLVELETRFELSPGHEFAAEGINETMSIDATLHSLFGASKAAADLLVQEYGLYFGMPTACFRGGCLTGPAHAGAELHGFLAYLVRACAEGRQYRVFGHAAKQVRDNLHAHDLVSAFWAFVQAPRPGEVYNIGGGRTSNCSMLEAMDMAQHHTGRDLVWTYEEDARVGDHIWWISDTSKFRSHYPGWNVTHNVDSIIAEIAAEMRGRG
jgi:CDP-paratose 2-epimerase